MHLFFNLPERTRTLQSFIYSLFHGAINNRERTVLSDGNW